MTDINDDKQNNSIALDSTPRLFPPYLFWFILIPMLPFLFGLTSLSFFIEPSPASEDIFIKKLLTIDIGYVEHTLKTLNHISSMFNYLSISAVHGILCLIVIGFFLYKTSNLPSILVRRTYLYMAVMIFMFLTVSYLVHLFANNLMLTQLGYKSICILLSKAELQTSIVWPDISGGHTGEACFQPRLTKLVWLAWAPAILGMLAIIVASAFTTVMASESIPSDDKQWRSIFLARIKLLQKSLYLLSMVLITSTVTIYQFSSLPLDLLTNQPFKSSLMSFINGLTAFWGAMFTATLFATFTPAALLFLRHTRAHMNRTTVSHSFGQWLYESVFVSIKKQMMNSLVMIAPMLVGPLSHLLQNLSG